jgi:hypothetical protein
MNLEQWAIKWGVSYEAIQDLRKQFGAINTDPVTPVRGNGEAAVQNEIRLEASKAGLRLWRNNVGAIKDERGVPVRYGLCNDNAQLNASLKSSDLIGIRPVLIQPHHVGTVIGQFVAREVKAPTWRYTATTREMAQLRFLELVTSLGGDACFANSVGTI